MTGTDLLFNELEKNNIQKRKSDDEGEYILTFEDNTTCTISIFKMADIFGSLTFFHHTPEKAITEMVDMLKHMTKSEIDAGS